MRWLSRELWCVLLLTLGSHLPVAWGQPGGGGGGAPGGGGAGAAVGGVEVDAQGVLRTRFRPDPTGQLTRQRLGAARAALGAQVAQPSKLRKVSLNRLEAAVAARLAQGQPPTEEMRYLAGLTRLQFVFVYPETQDVVIAGPAEGFGADLSGRMVGVQSGLAVLDLADLVVAMRAFPPGGKGVKNISCSIDPTQEGLANMQQFLRNLGRITPGDAGRLADGLRRSLGLHTVSIRGISQRTHFAQVLVEADYRMKLIGIGLESPPVNLQSWVSRANPRDVAKNAMQRWYFVPDYECVCVSDDRLAMELVGQGVKLISEDEMVQADGTRTQVRTPNLASEAFVQAFTKAYPQMAQRSPVWGQLRNVIDMAIAAAYMQQQDFYGQTSWQVETLGNEQRFPVETLPPPTHVECAVNVVWRGSTLMTPIGGGVSIQPQKALVSSNLRSDDGKVKGARTSVVTTGLDKTQWWWD